MKKPNFEASLKELEEYSGGKIPKNEAGEKVYEERPMFKDLLKNGLVHPLKVEWIGSEELTVNERTGKLRRIIDDRG